MDAKKRPSGGTWLPGHDQRAIRERIGKDFGGDVASFIDWYDEEPPLT